jgi:hypothetical protein
MDMALWLPDAEAELRSVARLGDTNDPIATDPRPSSVRLR